MLVLLLGMIMQAAEPADAPAPAEAVTRTEEAATIMADYQFRTRANVGCASGPEGDEIVVCARRRADDYRVPLIVAEVGDPKAPDALGERDRLLAQPNECQKLSPFQVGCGSVGISVSTRGGFQPGVEQRPLAP